MASSSGAGGKEAGGSIIENAQYGLSYIGRRPGLLLLLTFFTIANFALAFAQVLFTPLLLSFTSVKALGTLMSVFGIALVCGGILMSVWKGPSRPVPVILGLTGFLGLALTACGARASVPLVAAGIACMGVSIPIVNACTQALWQRKTAPEVQGRVFAVQRMIAQAATPLAYVTAGPLADRVFTPLLVVGGPLAPTVGRLIGVGPGRGIALLFITAGLVMSVTAGFGFLLPRLRGLEEEVEDALPERFSRAGS